ncbi:MAG: response regulator [SAR324 cluster bacterium]|nr:response regulator [SAR324 cluster bacterium]
MDTDMKILIVDDFAATRKIIFNTFAQLGFNNTDEEDDGFSALVRLKSALFDLVVIDWKISKMSGMELLKQIRTDPNLKHIPVLMVNEDGLQENIVAATKAGLNAYIIRPFEVKTFAEKLEKIFN